MIQQPPHSKDADGPQKWAGRVGIGGATGDLGQGPVLLSSWLRGEAMGRARGIGRSTAGNDLRPETRSSDRPSLPPNKSTDLRQPGGLKAPNAKPTGPADRKRSKSPKP